MCRDAGPGGVIAIHAKEAGFEVIAARVRTV
jgi:hypothetical protein